jgi:diacylglycerol kinase family enzyme
MNAQYVGRHDAAPRAHPGDGLADVVEVAAGMSMRERWQATRRSPLGTHVPHRWITTRRVREATVDLGRPTRIVVDGWPMGRASSMTITVEPDAFTAYV